jgi:hypothetical protein
MFNNKKMKVIHVRFDGPTYSKLLSMSDRLDMPVSEIIRRNTREHLQQFDDAVKLPGSRIVQRDIDGQR